MIYILSKEYIIATGMKKLQIKYILPATIVGYFGGCMNFFLWYDIPIPPYPHALVAVYAFLMTYAIFRTHILDINLIFRKTILYSILIGLITGVYVSAIFLFGQLLQGLTGGAYLIITLVSIFIFALLFQPIKNYAQIYIDKLFFKDKYNYQETLKHLSEAATTIIDLNALLKLTCTTIVKKVKVEQAYFYLFDKKTKAYLLKEAVFYDDKQTQQLTEQVEANLPLMLYLRVNRQPIVLEEVAREIETSGNPNSQHIKNLSAVKEGLEKVAAALCIPLFFEGQLIGLFNLGNKLSQDMYTDEDIDLLTTLSNQLSIAIENAVLHEEMLQAQKQLLMADKLASLGRIAAGIAHEIKNPLTAVKGMTQALEMNPDDKECLSDFKEVVPKEIDRLNNLVNNLVRFGKSPKLQFKQVDVNTIIENALRLFSSRCRNRNIEIKKELGPVPEIKADPEQLTQVFTNLILNAIQAIGSDGGQISFKTQEVNNHVLIEVADSGQGIPQDKLKNIFDPFFSTKEEGSGFGLAITYKIIQDHKGEITVESKLGHGTKFRIGF